MSRQIQSWAPVGVIVLTGTFGLVLLAQFTPPTNTGFRPPSYTRGSIRYGGNFASTSATHSRGQVINPNAQVGSAGFTEGVPHASRWLLPSENRLAVREMRLEGDLPSQMRNSGYLGNHAPPGAGRPPGHRYTDYLGTIGQHPGAGVPRAPRQPSYRGIPGPRLGGTAAVPRGSVRYGASHSLGASPVPLSSTTSYQSSYQTRPIGASGTIRYGPP